MRWVLAPIQLLCNNQQCRPQCVQAPISSPVVTPSPTFDVHLDVADLEFLQKKLGECKGRLGSALTNAMGENPYVKIVSVLEQSLREG